MISSFRDEWLSRFYTHDERHRLIPAEIESRVFRKLQMIVAASKESDLRVPPGNRFEHLAGQLNGWCSIRVNEQYRLIFKWDGEHGEATDVYLDPHTYR